MDRIINDTYKNKIDAAKIVKIQKLFELKQNSKVDQSKDFRNFLKQQK